MNNIQCKEIFVRLVFGQLIFIFSPTSIPALFLSRQLREEREHSK